MKNLPIYLAIILPACLPQLACAGTQNVLETAQAKLDEAKALAEQAKSKVAEAEAKRQQICAEALDVLQATEAVAPFACGLVNKAPDAPEQAKATCAHQGKLNAAVANFQRACELK